MSRTDGIDAIAAVRAKEEIAQRRKEVEAAHTVVPGEVVQPDGRTTR